MAARFMQLALTPAVQAAQDQFYGRHQAVPAAPERDALTVEEADFIATRDSFYLATVNAAGWPYVQHRGGPPGFLKVLSPQQLGFADFKGNRQLLTTGNLHERNRISLFLMDYPRRERLKILGYAQVLDSRANPDLAAVLTPAPELRENVERLFIIDVVGFDWNCSQYITPRYTRAEMETVTAPLHARIAELEAQLGNLLLKK